MHKPLKGSFARESMSPWILQCLKLSHKENEIGRGIMKSTTGPARGNDIFQGLRHHLGNATGVMLCHLIHDSDVQELT